MAAGERIYDKVTLILIHGTQVSLRGRATGGKRNFPEIFHDQEPAILEFASPEPKGGCDRGGGAVYLVLRVPFRVDIN